MSWAAGVLRTSRSVGAAGADFFCLRMALCALQTARIPVRGGWPFTRVSVAGSTACLAVFPRSLGSLVSVPELRAGLGGGEGRKGCPHCRIIFGGAAPLPSLLLNSS